MLEKYFDEMEIAEELGIPNDAVKDLLTEKMNITKIDVDKLLACMVKKIKANSIGKRIPHSRQL